MKRAEGGDRQGLWWTLSVSDGLPHNAVYSLLEDASGQLWVGTRGGLSRWDGTTFTTYTTEDGLPHNAVPSLLEDASGQLWVGTRGGLGRWDGTTFTTYTTEDGLPHNYVYSLLEDASGQLWVGTMGGLSRWDGTTFTTYTAEDGLPHNYVYSLLEDASGQLWVGTMGGLSRWDGSTFTTYTAEDGLPHNAVPSLLEDASGQLWVGTGGGLSRWDGTTFTTYTTEDGLPHNYVYSLLEDASGQLWVGTVYGGGLSRWDGSTFTAYTAEDGLPHNYVYSLLEDASGQLWVGTEGGLSRWDGSTFTTYTTEDGLPHNAVYSLLEDASGQLWVGTVYGGLSRWDGSTFTTYTTEDGLPHNAVYSLLEDASGQLWVGTRGGLGRWDGSTFTAYTTEDGLPHNWVYSLLEDASGQLWVGTRGGLGRWDGSTFTTYTTEDGLPYNWVPSLLEDASGQLWVGTTGGLSRWDGTTFTTYTTEDGRPHNGVWSLLEDASGQLWVGTTGGLSRWDGTTFTTYTTEDGLPHNWVRSLLEDASGQLWVGTGGGLSRWDGLVFQNSLRRDGLPGNIVSLLLQDRHGELWIATDRGLTHYQHHPVPPSIRLVQVMADRVYSPDTPIRVPSVQQYLAFQFRGISLKTRPGRLVYLYRLAGYEEQWQQTRDTRVEYNPLPEGTYQFQVKAVDRDLTYSALATVDLEVYHQPTEAPVQLAALEVEDVFASFYTTYAHTPLGAVQVRNNRADTLDLTLRFSLPDLIRRPVEQALHLPPQASQRVELTGRLEPEVLAQSQVSTHSAEVLAFVQGEAEIAVRQIQELTLYGYGALRWDTVARAAAFITPTEPQVTTFARSLLVAFEKQTHSLGRPGQPLLQALVLFEALSQHGVRYLADSNTPYAQVAADRAVIDHIQYPAQVLQHKAGDCDDLTVLYASLLESAGIATALVDYPGHIFLLFDSGVERRAHYQLPLEERRFLMRGDRLWIPVEITQVGQPFLQAWQAGSDQLAQLSVLEQRRRIVDTATAWQQYPATAPPFEGTVEPPVRLDFEAAVATQQAALQTLIDTYIDVTYRDPLTLQPDDNALRTRLLKVYLGLRQVDTAIKIAVNYLLNEHGSKAAIRNELGNAFWMKGDLAQAALNYKEAAALRPNDAGIRHNLERARQALGLQPARPDSLAATAAGSPKAGVTDLQVEDFYWIEE